MKTISSADKRVFKTLIFGMIAILGIIMLSTVGLGIYNKYFNAPPKGTCGNVFAFDGPLNQSQFDQVNCFVLAYQNRQKASVVVTQHGVDTSQTDFLETDGYKITDKFNSFINVGSYKQKLECATPVATINEIKISCENHEIDFASNGRVD